MSDKFRAISFLRRVRQHLHASVGGRLRIVTCLVGLVILAAGTAVADVYLRNLFPFLDFTGFSGTYSNTGSVDLSGPFFQSLGTNGRTCGTCHEPSDAFGLSAVDALSRPIRRGYRPFRCTGDLCQPQTWVS